MRDEKLRTWPDMGSLVDAMNAARERGDEEWRAQYNQQYERSHAHSDGWGTHAPMLASVIATASPGPVLEIGVGRCSSPLVVEMCRAMGRDLVGIDSELAWLAELDDLNYPQRVHMPDWAELPAWMADKYFAVIFIDNGPGDARLPTLKAARGHAEFIVCHDTFNPGYLIGFDAYLSTFKYKSDYTLMPSTTSVVSDVRPYAGAT